MSSSTLYHANTIGNLISVIFALSVGVISKKFSLKTLTVLGLFIGGISYILIPLVPAWMTGIFIATNYIATMFYAQITVGARIGNWYPKRKGEILGIVTSVIIVSSLVWLPLFSKASSRFGIAHAMMFVGILVILLAVAGIFVIMIHRRVWDYFRKTETWKRKRKVSVAAQTEWTYKELLKKPDFLIRPLAAERRTHDRRRCRGIY